MNIHVEVIPHDQQRYNTIGDWIFWYIGLRINVSQLPPSEDKETYETLIAIHEIIEAILCKASGITDEQVCEWDKTHLDAIEPGNIPEAPYYRQHLLATVIERILADELGIDWDDYEKAIKEVAG